MKIDSFSGINNVAPPTKLRAGELVAATDVDIDVRGRPVSRRGRTLLAAEPVVDIFEAPFGIFGRVGNDLKLFSLLGATIRTVYDTLGYDRVNYVLLPDGRVGFTNGLIQGMATLTETQAWGIPRPPHAGVGSEGKTAYHITYVRTSDGLEGPPTYATDLVDGHQLLIGLPALEGHMIRVYLTFLDHIAHYAGQTATDSFQWDGATVGPIVSSSGLDAPPPGKLLHVWNSRVLIAADNVLWATRPMQPELCVLTKDFIQFPDEITLLYGNGDGVFVGTSAGLYFLAGRVFEQLKAQQILPGSAILGSCVEADLSQLPDKVRPSGVQQGAFCLIDGYIHLLHGAGGVTNLTAGRYRTSSGEVRATVRMLSGVPHYFASPL